MTDSKPEIILASSSPRRRELLKLLGLNFRIHPSNFDEKALSLPTPELFALEAARQKALALKDDFSSSIILSADTIVTLDNIIFGKPADRDEARKYLKMLRAKTHIVMTGIALWNPSKSDEPVSDVVKTFVTMRDFSDREIDSYIETKEPLDKAGAYGIQGHGGELIEKIDGCYFNVVGLPIRRMLELLNEFFDTSEYYSKIPESFRLY